MMLNNCPVPGDLQLTKMPIELRQPWSARTEQVLNCTLRRVPGGTATPCSGARFCGLGKETARPPLPFPRSEEHTSELQSLMRISYAVFCLKKKKTNTNYHYTPTQHTPHHHHHHHTTYLIPHTTATDTTS